MDVMNLWDLFFEIHDRNEEPRFMLMNIWDIFFEVQDQEDELYLRFIQQLHIKIPNFYEDIVAAYSLNGKKINLNFIVRTTLLLLYCKNV